MLHVISACVLVVIGLGLFMRRRSYRWHITLMGLAFATDIGLLLYIELSRHAIAQTVGASHPLLYVHVAISVAMLGCYIAMFFLGRFLLKADERKRPAHRTVGITFCVLRVLNFVTALMV